MLHHRARHVAHLGGLLALLLTVGMLAGSAQAATSPGAIRVAPTGTDASGCGTVAQPCRTPYYAVQQSLTNDVWSGEIRIAGGTYTQATNSHLINLTVYPSNIRIIGGFNINDWESSDPLANPTILDGQGVNRAIVISPTDSAAPNCNITIANLTIQNGKGTPDDPAGGGIVINSCQNARISNVTIKDSISRGADNTNAGGTSAGTGGGIAVRGSAAIKARLILQNVVLQNNQAVGGNEASGSRGGLGVGGGLFAINANVRAINLTLTGNIARGGDAPGRPGSLNGQFADGLGGGIGAIDSPSIDIDGMTATGNTVRGGNAGGVGAYALGGGVFLERSVGNISNATINGNVAIAGNATSGGATGGGSEGGAIHTTGTPLTLTNVVMANNSVSGGTGAVAAENYGGALFMTTAGNPSSLTATNVVVAENVVNGGGFAGGGGIGLRDTTFNIAHMTLADNTINSSSNVGQAILFFLSQTTGTMSNSITSGHTGSSSFYGDNGASNITVSRLMNNDTTTTLFGGTGITAQNTITGNPNFVSPGSPDYDYRISAGSAAINQATGSTTTVDLEGQPRPIGAGSDIGADEFQVDLTSTGGNGTVALSWDDPPGSTVTSYRIDYTKSAGAANAAQGASGFNAGNVNGLTLTGLTSGATYTITVVALNGAVEVTRSRAVTVVASNYPINLPLVVY